MKKLNLVCPKCGSTNARQWGREEIHFFDEEFYSIIKKEFGEDSDCENHYTANCICDDCENHFKAKVMIDIEATEIRY